MSNFVEAKLRHNSTIFNEDWPSFFAKFVEQCCRRIRQQFSTTFSYNIRQHSTKFFVECWRKMSNTVICWRKMMSKNIVDLRQYFQTTFFDKVLQHLTKNLSNDVEICFMLSKNLSEKCRHKMLSKNAVKKCCWIKLQQFFSTNFYSKFLGLFVK